MTNDTTEKILREIESNSKYLELKIKLQATLNERQRLARVVREEIETQIKNDDNGLTPTKDVLLLILNRLGLSEGGKE